MDALDISAFLDPLLLDANPVAPYIPNFHPVLGAPSVPIAPPVSAQVPIAPLVPAHALGASLTLPQSLVVPCVPPQVEPVPLDVLVPPPVPSNVAVPPQYCTIVVKVEQNKL